jgi:hypothetical protein
MEDDNIDNDENDDEELGSSLQHANTGGTKSTA